MISRLKALFGDGGQERGRDELQLAAAALLVEAALMDEDFDAVERKTITHLLCRRFSLTEAEAKDLIAEAESAVAAETQILPFTRVVKDRLSNKERIGLIEMLWEVAYADGKLHDYEAHLLRRIGGLIYVTDKDRGAARKRVLARLGIAD